MGKHSRCVFGICDNDMRYQGCIKKKSNVDGDSIMQKLPKDGAVRTVWTNAMLGDKKQ